nr:MAG TPA: hypothetical protein [Caudoviricetes sp.]
MYVVLQHIFKCAIGFTNLTLTYQDVTPTPQTGDSRNVNPAAARVKVKRRFVPLAHILLHLVAGLKVPLFVRAGKVVQDRLNDALFISSRQVHKEPVMILPILAFGLRGADEIPACFLLNKTHIAQRNARNVQSEHNTSVTQLIRGLNGCTGQIQGGAVVHGFGCGVNGLFRDSHNIILLLLFADEVIQFVVNSVQFGVNCVLRCHHGQDRFADIFQQFHDFGQFVIDILHTFTPSENPAQQELLCGRIAVGGKEGGRRLIGEDSGDVVPLGFQLCHNLFHGLSVMVARIPLRGVREAAPRRFLECMNGQGVEFTDTGNHVQHVAVLVVHNTIDVLRGIFIQHNVRYVGNSGAGIRASIRH